MRRKLSRIVSPLVCSAGIFCGCSSNTAAVSPDSAPVTDTVASDGEFSFFAVSLRFIQSKAPCQGSDGKTCVGGLGGDLRNGKANGIDGADSLCAEAAQVANPGDSHVWRAFLSAGNYNGAVLNAIDRIGTGPWYSAPPKYQGKSSYAREGLLVAKDKAGLLKSRPDGDATTIVYNGVNQSMGAGNAQSWPFNQCLTDEHGDCTQANGDDHDTLTGSKADGTYAGSAATTCDDWTNKTNGYGAPTFGHTWPRQLNAVDTAANWIDTGEAGEFACGAVINVSSTNYFGGGGSFGGGNDPSAFDGGRSPGDWGGGMPPGEMDAGMMFPMDIPDGGFGPGMGPPPFAGDGGNPGAGNGGGNMGSGGMGESTGDSSYTGGVGSGGGYGAFYCFAYITGAE